ncbi:MAG: iron-only hydrogenase system regulator [Ruminococcus sp.]|nr:iron-only hydrogenase system regulator [Ruminococcus sp.]
MNRIALVGIMVENTDSVAKLNEILHEYMDCIKGRMGVPHAGGRIQVISVVLEASADRINTLSGRLGRLDGVTAKAIYAKEQVGGE